MLRSATEADLNDLHVHLLEAADLYKLLVERHGDAAVQHLFEELAARRRQAAEMTECFIRGLGALPDVPDTDWETLEGLLARARQALTPNHEPLIMQALNHEAQLAMSVEHLLNQPVTEETRRFLEAVQQDTLRAREHLEQARTPGRQSPQ